MKRTIETKFWNFRQNNSGGAFDIADNVTINTIIEATDADDANRRAEAVGVYFDGCENGADCECCGDRWCRAWGDGDPEPMLYGKPIEQAESYDQHFAQGKPDVVIHYMDGTKKLITTKSKR